MANSVSDQRLDGEDVLVRAPPEFRNLDAGKASEAHSGETSKGSPQLFTPFWTFVVTVAFAGGIGVGSAWVVGNQVRSDLEAQLVARPPVAIIDLAKAATKAASSDEADRIILEAQDLTRRLKDAGYVVLEANSVLAAPDDIMLNPADYATDKGTKP